MNYGGEVGGIKCNKTRTALFDQKVCDSQYIVGGAERALVGEKGQTASWGKKLT